MRLFFRSALLVAVLIPSVAHAQRRAAPVQKEIGVDVGIAYQKPENVDGGIAIGTPVDIRLGLGSRGKTMLEPRVTFAFNTVGGETEYVIAPGVNALHAMTPGGHRRGMFLSGGGSLILADNGQDAGTALALNGGVGWRKPWGTGAWRYEVGFRYTFANDDLGVPSTIELGARIGISLWK